MIAGRTQRPAIFVPAQLKDDLSLLSERQMGMASPFFPLADGVARVVSGVVYVIKNGLPWRDAPKGHGPHKTLHNRFIRGSRRFNKRR